MRFPTLPPEEQAGLARIMALNEDQSSRLQVILQNAPITLSREAFVAGLQPIEGVTAEDLEKIIWCLMYLTSYLVAGDIEVREFSQDVSVSFTGPPFDGPASAKQLADRLATFLAIDSLRLRAKAVDLQVDHAHVLQGTRVLTEMRPVFQIGSASEVAGVLLYHTLKIQYYKDEESREIFITLDDRDIIKLKEDLERAEEKAKILRAIFSEKLHFTDFGSAADSSE